MKPKTANKLGSINGNRLEEGRGMDPQDAAIVLEAVSGLVLAVGVAGLLVMLGAAANRAVGYLRRGE